MTKTKGKITYKQFITKFEKTEQDKIDEFLSNHIVASYVDYAEKLNDVKNITSIGNFDIVPSADGNDTEKRIYKRNTPIMYFLLKIRLLVHYTDIDIEEGENSLEIYTTLEKLGILDRLIALIPETEIKKWNTLLDMVNNDIYMNERDFAGYLDTKVDAAGMMLDTMLSSLGDVISKLELAQNED